MKTAAVYNVWDGLELLYHSVDNIRPLVDGVIIVYSRRSNRGEHSNEFNEADFSDCTLVNSEPAYRNNPSESERIKRNVGLDTARDMGFSHFLMMDCDEFYDPVEFGIMKEYIEKNDMNGVVCPVQVYFRSPALTIGLDPATRVCFIQKITPRLKFRINKGYPYAYDANGPRIDPTRQLTHNSAVQWFDFPMHHYSWVRRDIKKKIRNSSAKMAGNPMVINDYNNAREGYFCNMYQRTLIACENKFNIEI